MMKGWIVGVVAVIAVFLPGSLVAQGSHGKGLPASVAPQGAADNKHEGSTPYSIGQGVVVDQGLGSLGTGSRGAGIDAGNVAGDNAKSGAKSGTLGAEDARRAMATSAQAEKKGATPGAAKTGAPSEASAEKANDAKASSSAGAGEKKKAGRSGRELERVVGVTLHFEHNASTLSGDEQGKLVQAARVLAANSGMYVVVRAYAATSEANARDIARARAKAVADAFHSAGVKAHVSYIAHTVLVGRGTKEADGRDVTIALDGGKLTEDPDVR